MASTDSTNIKPYTERVGALHFTDDATTVTALSIPTRNDHSYDVYVRILATETADFDEIASYHRIATFKNDGGTLSLVGAVSTPHVAEDTAGWNATLDASGTNIRVRITGAAATNIAWQIAASVIEGGKTAFLNTVPDPDQVQFGNFNG